jgi:NAD(P)-dependent dehydrogenase (short-subunit alcohol dehydrogenase family)
VFLEKIRFDGKVAMIVGSGGEGHGTATTIALAEAGADIVAVDISKEALAVVERRIKPFNRRFLGLVVDVTKKAQVEKMVADAVKAMGGIHCLVNVVGGMQKGQWHNMLDCPEEVYDAILDLNLRTAFLTCQAVARSMVERKIAGSIVNFSSSSCMPTAPEHAVYGAAKRGIICLSETMALEWSEYGIRVNVVAPASMRVPRQGGRVARTLSFEDVTTEHVPNKTVPLGYSGTPIHIASAVLFLLSDLASYVTGHTIPVDGGMKIKTHSRTDTVRTMFAAS